MLELRGKYNTAKVFTVNIDSNGIGQIITLMSEPFVKDSQVRIMPDVHAGEGAVVGFTMTVSAVAIPSLVGADIGCGMETAALGVQDIDLEKVDEAAHFAAGIRKKTGGSHPYNDKIDWASLRCFGKIDIGMAKSSMATLGGGNHFIELGRGSDGRLYLVVHSGSRRFGRQISLFYQKKAQDYCRENKQRLIEEGRFCNDWNHTFIEGNLFDDYISDLKAAQNFALLNRQAIIEAIAGFLGVEIKETFSTIHNYIDTDAMILRKGAISAQKDERVLIPMNMRDGSLLCVGKGNPDWNFSAPHGAGRIMSRSEAKTAVSLEEFIESMKGVYSSTISQSTIDESPFVYKPIDEIIENVADTVDVIDIIKPIYNFKAGK